jgi:hypothetical protein
VESGGVVKAGVDDGEEDGIDVAVGVNVGGGAVFVSGLRAEVCTGAGVCASWGVQVCAFRSGRFVNSWFPFFDGVSLPTTSRRSTRGGVAWPHKNGWPLPVGIHSVIFRSSLPYYHHATFAIKSYV